MLPYRPCSEGLKVSLSFFSDVFIPSYAIPTPKEFDANDKLWWGFCFGAHIVLTLPASASNALGDFSTAAHAQARHLMAGLLHFTLQFRRCWDFDGNQMWFDVDQDIKFRVQSVKFNPVPTRADMQVASWDSHDITASVHCHVLRLFQLLVLSGYCRACNI